MLFLQNESLLAFYGLDKQFEVSTLADKLGLTLHTILQLLHSYIVDTDINITLAASRCLKRVLATSIGQALLKQMQQFDPQMFEYMGPFTRVARANEDSLAKTQNLLVAVLQTSSTEH